MNNTFTYEFDDKLERILMTPDMEKRIQKIVRSVLSKARSRLSADIKSTIGNTPHQAYKAVKYSVYKRVLGGNLSILNKRKAGRRSQVQPSSRGRSQRTEDILSYQGADRGFILRFLNSGTGSRKVKNMNGHSIRLQERPKSRRYKGDIGNRGSITPRNFFTQNGQKEMEEAMEQLSQLINEEINRILYNG